VLPSARTRLRLDMLPNSLEDVAITKGSAYVEGNGNRTRVHGGEHILLEEGHSEVLPLNPADSWELWNVDRDRQQARSARADSYLPDELRSNAAELDASGSWVRVPEYGMVWRPTVMVSDEWAPYRDGRWIWRGDDYVWLSFEPWGWVPYHFGRWAVVSGIGWCWVPPVRGDVYWGPGYVGWYTTGSNVGWTPLAPGEVFYGHRNYGRLSVNITNVTINTTSVVYRNRNNRGGLTVLPQNDFLRGRSAIQQPSRNASVSVSIGSPRIQPLRESRMPIVRQTATRLAPPRIEQRDSRELRTRFPRITQEPTAERRRQQPAAAVPVPAAPSSRTPLTREKQTTYPVAAPTERTSTQDRQPSQSTPPQRDEQRQRTTPPQSVAQPSQPAAPASHTLPPVSAGVQQPAEQPRRATSPADSQNRPSEAPSRGEGRPGVKIAPAAIPPQTAAPQRVEQPRRVPAAKVIQQKKVWKVTTPENGSERDSRENDNRGRERRDK